MIISEIIPKHNIMMINILLILLMIINYCYLLMFRELDHFLKIGLDYTHVIMLNYTNH